VICRDWTSRLPPGGSKGSTQCLIRYIVGPDGEFDWTAPDEEVLRFVTDEIREVGVHLLGRRLYETML
jgi:hypothetical protein